MSCMYKIAVIGDYDSICGFLALGIDIYPLEMPEELPTLIKRLAQNNYAIIYVVETPLLAVEIEKYQDVKIPAIIPIPGISGSLGIGLENVKKSVERAVGSDIL